VLALLLASAASANAAAPAVSVFPPAGSRTASPATQIAFRGLPVTQLGAIAVTGSVSGSHPGTVAGDSDGQGGSFLPTTPFRAGELVTVSTGLNIIGGRGGRFSFRVARPAPRIPYAGLTPVKRVRGDVSRYHSRPDLVPAAVAVTKRATRTAPGDIFLAPQLGPIQNGPMIADPNGRLVWFKPQRRNTWVTDFRVQSYGGQPALTWWQGNETAGTGIGEGVIDNSHYQQIATVKAANGLSEDLHEFALTPQNTALITAYYPVYWDTSSIRRGSKRAIVLDGVVQEIDIATGLVLFQWNSLDHVALTDSYSAYPKKRGVPFDYFHVNSIQLDNDGTLLVSARDTSTVYKLDPRTGAVIWRLGGRHSSFRMGAGTSTALQHDMRVHPGGLVSMFDNGGGPPRLHSQSRALFIRVDTIHRTVRLVRAIDHSPKLTSNFEGNVQLLANGDSFVGWGQQPYFTEYNSRGRTVFDARFVDENNSYRAYRFPWNGAPLTPPAVAASKSGKNTIVYASWNGATSVASWRVLAGAAPTSLRAVATARRHGFETAIRASGHQRYVAVQPLDGLSRVLGTSSAVAVR
jgi:Arylsulfotransferase (ASST)